MRARRLSFYLKDNDFWPEVDAVISVGRFFAKSRRRPDHLYIERNESGRGTCTWQRLFNLFLVQLGLVYREIQWTERDFLLNRLFNLLFALLQLPLFWIHFDKSISDVSACSFTLVSA